MNLRMVVIVVILTLTVAPAAFGSCTPAGYFSYFYNHVSNGGPASDECWDPYHAVFTTDYVCGSTVKAYSFGYAGSISQQVVIPSSMTAQNFAFSYELDFIDPTHSSYDQIQVSVYDMTTYTSLATDFYNGSSSDLSCSPRSITFSGSLAGHTINILISGSAAASGTVIRVRNIALWQW